MAAPTDKKQKKNIPFEFPLISGGDRKLNDWLELERKNQLRLQERFFWQRKQELNPSPEKIVFTKAEQELKVQISLIQTEIKKLILSTKNLVEETKITVEQFPSNPGVYHLNFLEKVKKAIILLKKRVDESATWLHEFSQRSKRRSYYWAQVKKSGSKFMLSQERYMSTQAG